MSGRKTILVAYDIADKKRLRTVFKKMRGYGDPLQYSVFRCELSDKEKELMIGALIEIIHQDADRILLADLGPTRGRKGRKGVQFLGRRIPVPDDGPVIV